MPDIYTKKLAMAVAGAILIVFSGYFYFSHKAVAQTPSPDLIAVRVIPNPDHYSASRWYKRQEFKGSPQAVLVDGYEAVRDGRTVYVNAANVDDQGTPEPGDDVMFTNIYVLAYNEAAEGSTVDIFGQMLKHWQFNANLRSTGVCRHGGAVCLNDKECAAADYCLSRKARLTRDTRRLGDMAEIRFSLSGYHDRYGRFPALLAGSYLPQKTLSAWPSWQNTLGAELAAGLPLDPINKLGGCSGYNPDTCWNENTKRFATALPVLPGYSYVYQYNANIDGSTYSLCAVMESGLVTEPVVCATACDDFDGDGYGDPAAADCRHPQFDCDDEDARVHPGAAENCTNGGDDDCDGMVDCADSGCSGHIACSIGCADTVCNNVCGAGCTSAMDPDCDCLALNGCCSTGCFADPDCGGVCPAGPLPCDGVCPSPFCTIADDPDCGCSLTVDNSCCGLGCTLATDINCHPPCADDDRDGYGTNGSPLCAFAGFDCEDRPAGADGIMNTIDDGRHIHSNAGEICNNQDDNCAGGVDETCDADGDDYCDCGHPFESGADLSAVCFRTNTTDTPAWSNTCDCDDEDARVHPGAAENCTNGRDDDCDGMVDCADNSCTVAACCGNGVCDAAVGESNAVCPADCPATCGNSVCEAGECVTCQSDCGLGDCCGNSVCNPPLENSGNCADCPLVCPDGFCDVAAGECASCDADCDLGHCCGNGACDAAVGENCGSCFGDCCSGCADGDADGHYAIDALCPIGDDCNDSSAAIHPGASENCLTADDDDCDGSVNCTDSDCAGHPSCLPTCTDADGDRYIVESVSPSTCAPTCGSGSETCIGNDCDDSDRYRFPGNPETCDGRDNDCDVAVDEGCDDDNDDYCDSGMTFYNYPLAVCPHTNLPNGSPGDDCNDLAAGGSSVHPGASELCNGRDDDCDAATPDGSDEPSQLNTKQNDICAGSTKTCTAGSMQDDYGSVPGYEDPEASCDDLVDNDCDGREDCLDTDCSGSPVCATCCTFDFFFGCDLCP